MYKVLPQIAKELNRDVDPEWEKEAENIKESINRFFWDSRKRTYRYLVDPNGDVNAQEGLGISFSILFDIADKDQVRDILKNIYIAPAGIPCLYPSFKRYLNNKGTSFGRHSGTIWPHVEGFWAEAAAKSGDAKAFKYEFKSLAEHARRDKQFVEIYNPLTGEKYGGMQEPLLKDGKVWEAANRQTWSATAYLRMILMGLFGMSFNASGINFNPLVPLTMTG